MLVSVSVPVLRGTVRGQLLDDGGEPTVGIITLLQSGRRTDVATDADGRFELAAEPGPALLSGRTNSEAPTPTITIEVPEPPAAAEVDLRTRGQREYEVLVDVFVDEPDGTTTGPEVSESYPDLLLRPVGNPFGAVPFRAVNRYTPPRSAEPRSSCACRRESEASARSARRSRRVTTRRSASSSDSPPPRWSPAPSSTKQERRSPRACGSRAPHASVTSGRRCRPGAARSVATHCRCTCPRPDRGT